MTEQEKIQYHKEYYQKHKDRLNIKNKEWAIKNAEKLKAYQKEYREKHKEKSKVYLKQYREDNREKLLELNRHFREAKPEAMKLYRKKSFEKNRHKYDLQIYARGVSKVLFPQLSPCEVCGTTENIHRHHPDYTRPEIINFLCRKHHNELHRKNQHV
jgi:hypothetical protein